MTRDEWIERIEERLAGALFQAQECPCQLAGGCEVCKAVKSHLNAALAQLELVRAYHVMDTITEGQDDAA